MLISNRARLRLVLLAGTVLGSLSAGHVLAQDATWTGGVSNVFGDGGNWSPGGTPSGTASFGSAGGTVIDINSTPTLGGFTFNAGANTYVILNNIDLTFTGAGIINNSNQTQILFNGGRVQFTNSSVAGGSIINSYNRGPLLPAAIVFFDNTSAGSASFTNNSSGTISFGDSSTAGHATFINNSGATIQFAFNSTAGNSDIKNSGIMYFFNSASAGDATIRNNPDSYILFNQTTTAGNATIDNSGEILFHMNSTGGNARLITNAGGITNFSVGFFSGASAGSIAGAGSYLLGAKTLTVGGNGDTTTVSGVISGDGGSLVKTGAGTLTLSGANTYTGVTTVDAGKLVVNGSIVSAVTVNGGTLGGAGTVGGITVASGGVVSPGNSTGTLTVTGNVSFAAGSTYQAEVNAAGQGDRIVASGTATLSGGTVAVLAENGNYAAATSHVILTASGGVDGQFATATSNLAFLTPSLVYDGQNVTLTMTRNDTSFGPGGDGGSGGGGSGSGGFIAQTRNQAAIAVASERLGPGNPIYDTLISATATEARAGFDLLSGEAHAQGVAVAIGESRLVREAILGRLRGRLLAVQGKSVATGSSADLPTSEGAATLPAPRFAIWGEAVGAHASTDGDGSAAALSRRTGGFILGVDVELYDTGTSSLRVGVAGGYTQSSFDVDTRLSSGQRESGHAALYAGARFGAWRLDGGLAYSFGDTSLTRQVRIRGFGDTLRADRDGWVAQAFAELGYAFTYERFAIEPFAQFALLRVSNGSGVERGGPAALRVFSDKQDLGFATLGLRAEAQLGTMPLFARGLLGWRHGFGDLTPQAATAFALGLTTAQVYAATIDRNALVAEAGLDWRPSRSTTLGLAYSAVIGDRTRDHALKGRLDIRF